MISAEPVPPGPVAETVSVPVAGMDEGALYRPAEVTVPETALHVVTLVAENCCVEPSITVALAGETTSFGTRVTVAVLLPLGPVALTVSVPDAVVTAGAV